MAHGFGIAKRFKETGVAIETILEEVRNEGSNEFDAYTKIFEEVETVLHDCNLSIFSEKFLIFMLIQGELKNSFGIKETS